MQAKRGAACCFPTPRNTPPTDAGDGAVVDGLVKDGLWDPHRDIHMGACAELCAERYGITRRQQVAGWSRVLGRGVCVGGGFSLRLRGALRHDPGGGRGCGF